MIIQSCCKTLIMISLLSNSILWLFTDNTASATEKNESGIGYEVIDGLAQQYETSLSLIINPHRVEVCWIHHFNCSSIYMVVLIVSIESAIVLPLVRHCCYIISLSNVVPTRKKQFAVVKNWILYLWIYFLCETYLQTNIVIETI